MKPQSTPDPDTLSDDMLMDVDEMIISGELPPDHPGYEQGFSTHSDDTPAAEMDDIQDKLITVQAALIKRLETERDALLSVIRTIAEPRRANEDAEQALSDIRLLARRVLVYGGIEALHITPDAPPVTHEEDGT